MNLGQGFPDWNAPEFIKEATIDAINTGPHSYARPMGISLFFFKMRLCLFSLNIFNGLFKFIKVIWN